MPHYKLHYFNVLGRGESIRQLLVLAGQDFEDFRFTRAEWPELKKNYQFGTVPVLEVDGKPIAQEFAICRFIAREYGFAGKNNFEAAQIDALADQLKDFQTPFKNYWMVAKDPESAEKAEKKKEFDEAVTANCTYLINALKSSGSGFLVGNSVTWLDVLVAEFFNTVANNLDSTIYDKFPALLEHRNKIHSIPSIKKWRETREQSPY